MERMRDVFSALVLSVLVTFLCLVVGPVLIVVMAAQGAVSGVRDVWVAWWAFVRLPWAIYREGK